MQQSNRSFWSFLTKSSIQQAYFNPPTASVDAFFDLAIRINAAPPRIPITVVWNQDLPHYDSTFDGFEDLGYHVAFSYFPFRADECGSCTAWCTDSRPWVGTEVMITHSIPGMVLFAMTGEYAGYDRCEGWQGSMPATTDVKNRLASGFVRLFL